MINEEAVIETVECRVGRFTRDDLYIMYRMLFMRFLDPCDINQIRRCVVNEHTQDLFTGRQVPIILFRFENGTQLLERYEPLRVKQLRKEPNFVTDNLEKERKQERRSLDDAEFSEFLCARREWMRGAVTLRLLEKLWPSGCYHGGCSGARVGIERRESYPDDIWLH